MNELFITMCIYTSTYNAACQSSIKALYTGSTLESYINDTSTHYIKLGNNLASEYNLKPLVFTALACNQIYQHNINLSLTSRIALNINKSYMLTGSWSF